MLDRIPTVQQFQKKLFKKMEDGFMELAKKIEKRPKLTIFLSLLVCVAPSPGLIRLNYEQEAIKLWNSETSDTRINHDWLMKVYPPDTRFHSIIFKAENVLKPDVLYTMYQVHRIILETRSKNNITWASSCQKVPVIMDPSLWKSSNGSNIYSSINVSTALSVSVDLYPDIYCAILDSFTSACLELSILELFVKQGEYQEEDFLSLTDESIVDVINTRTTSGIFNVNRNFSKLLGGITYDRNGRIIGARTAQMGLVARVDKQELRDFPVSDSIEVTSSQVLEFEYSLIESLLAGNYTQGVQVYPNIQLSFGEVSNRIALKDCYNFIPGVILQFIYLFISVRRPWFVLAGLATVGFATLATISIASIARISFTSLSLILPLLLLGIGVDDMFILVKGFENEVENGTDQKDRLLQMIRKAGVSITVTSVTDLFAFFTGSLTLLPCVRSFSIVSAIGVLFLYFLSSTFLIACISIETSKEKEKKGEKQCCCFSPAPGSTDNCPAPGSADNCPAGDSTEDSTDSTESCSFSLDMRCEVGYLLTESITFKLVVICIAGGVLGVSVWGSTMLRDEFDPGVFIPKDSYLGLFYEAEREYFPEVGDTVVLYFANVNHTKEFVRIRNLLLTLEKEKHIAYLDNWTEDFMNYLNHYVFKKSATTFIDTESYAKLLNNGTFFQEKLIQFLFSIKGSPRRSVFKNFDTMDVSCGGSDTVLFSNLRYRHVQLGDSEERMKAMMAVKDLINASNIQGHVFTMSRDYANLETEQVVKAEIFRNMTLVFLCVLIISLFLLADLITSFLVVFTVILTLVNIMGFMYFLGLTLTGFTCLMLILSCGLSIDFAAHVAHGYITSSAETRKERVFQTIKECGPAIFHGGFSTFVVFLPLAASQGYVCMMIFQIMTMTVWFGLFNGLVLLPTLLSLIGPVSGVKCKQSDVTLTGTVTGLQEGYTVD